MHPLNALNPRHAPALPAGSQQSATPQRVFVACLQPGDQLFEAPADVSLLLAAQHAGITMASSCRNGTCRACLRQLVSGSIRYRIEWPGVSAQEKRDGLILPCVASATSDVVLAPPDDT